MKVTPESVAPIIPKATIYHGDCFFPTKKLSFPSSSSTNLESENASPSRITLHQNYPNPFNPTTKIKYNLPIDGLVNISIYDLMGRSVKSLVNVGQAAGFYEINWNATNNNGELVPAGMYFYMIQAGTFKSTKKMILLK